jgi:hypothetical protein
VLPIAPLIPRPRPWSWLGLIPLCGAVALARLGAGAFGRAGTPIVLFEQSTTLVMSYLRFHT